MKAEMGTGMGEQGWGHRGEGTGWGQWMARMRGWDEGAGLRAGMEAEGWGLGWGGAGMGAQR